VKPLESWTYTSAGKAKRVPIFPTEKAALRALAAKLRGKTAHKVFIIRWDELHEVDLLPARGGTRHAIMAGIRIRVNTWYETKAAAKRDLLKRYRAKVAAAASNLREARRSLKRAVKT
jgi:hypothetical protein